MRTDHAVPDEIVHSLWEFSILHAVPLDELRAFIGAAVGDIAYIHSQLRDPEEVRAAAENRIEGYQLFSAGSKPDAIYFVIHGALVLYDPDREFGDLETGDPIVLTKLLQSTRCFGVYRYGEHVGESEFVIEPDKYFASAYLCHSSGVIKMSCAAFRKLLLQYPEVGKLLEKDGALRRVMREFDTLFPTEQVKISFKEAPVRRLIEHGPDRPGTVEELMALCELFTRHATVDHDTNKITLGKRKTSYTIYNEFRAARLIASYLSSRVNTSTFKQLPGDKETNAVIPQTKAAPEIIGYYLRVNSAGQRLTTALQNNGVLGQKEAGVYPIYMDRLDTYLWLYRTVFLSAWHSLVESLWADRRINGAKIWLQPSNSGTIGDSHD